MCIIDVKHDTRAMENVDVRSMAAHGAPAVVMTGWITPPEVEGERRSRPGRRCCSTIASNLSLAPRRAKVSCFADVIEAPGNILLMHLAGAVR